MPAASLSPRWSLTTAFLDALRCPTSTRYRRYLAHQLVRAEQVTGANTLELAVAS